jgi:hypothetical protein
MGLTPVNETAIPRAGPHLLALADGVSNFNHLRGHEVGLPFSLSLSRAYSWRKSSPHLVDGAGQWVQQEQAEWASELLLQFLRDSAKS